MENTLTVQNREFEAMQSITPQQLQEQMRMLHKVISDVMKESVDYGTIPGTSKPTLYQPGAQKICMLFGLKARYTINREDYDGGHREYEVTAELYNSGGQFMGAGVGNCSTLESRYRFRNAGLTCPECGKMDTIIKGKAEYGGGFICYERKGGCKAKFSETDPKITGQTPGRVEHDNPTDYWNTVKKMACKRAYVMATLNATAASEIYTQDVEDMVENEKARTGKYRPASSAQKPSDWSAPGAHTVSHDKDGPATEPQKGAIEKILKRILPDGTEFDHMSLCADTLGITETPTSLSELTVSQASHLIKNLGAKK